MQTLHGGLRFPNGWMKFLFGLTSNAEWQVVNWLSPLCRTALMFRASWSGMREVGYQVEENLLTSEVTNQLVKPICTQNEIIYIDVVNEFRQQESDLYFKWDGHFNVAGQRLFGELLAERLKLILP